jgi:threonine dehydrogenase-like Zn-dependent dehydrogenase
VKPGLTIGHKTVGRSMNLNLGNTIDGTQAEYVLVLYAQANLTLIPDDLRDEEVLLLPTSARQGLAS